MFKDSDTHEDRLHQAAAALRQSAVRTEVMDRAEDAILSRVKPQKSVGYRGLLLAAGLSAAALATVFFLMPAKSYAEALHRIALNGDKEMRHLQAFEVRPDGSLKLNMEFFTDGVRTRMVYANGQLLWEPGKLINYHYDGSAEVSHYANEFKPSALGLPESAQQLLAINSKNPGTSVDVRHNVAWNGQTVDQYVVDEDIADGQRQPLHIHWTLTADPQSQRPLETVEDMTGKPREIERWDYAPLAAGALTVPGLDPARTYDTEAQRDSIKLALASNGRRAVVAGKTVELLQFWVDEHGFACALTQADYGHPDNFGIKIDGVKEEAEPETDEPFSSGYLVHQPSMQGGRPIQLFYNNRDNQAPLKRFPDFVTVEIPVFKDKQLVGYAKFEHVKVNRTWQVHNLLEPMNLPFWDKSGMPAASATSAAP